MQDRFYNKEIKNDIVIYHSIDKGDILIEQCNEAGVYNFNSWRHENYLDKFTVAIFRITKFKL